MEAYSNAYGETVTSWQSHKHPNNPDFMQIVYWTIWEKPDGRISIAFRLDTNGKSHFIYGMTKEDAIKKFTDK